MCKVCRCIKRYWILLLIGLVLILSLVFPLIFNKMFQQPAQNEWMKYSAGTGDMLDYFVSIFSAIGTLSLGIIAYGQNERLLKLESDSRAVFLKVNIEKCKVLRIKNNTYLSIQLENIDSNVPISEITIKKSNKRVIKNTFIENNKSRDKIATFITELNIQDDEKFTCNDKNINYTFDISDFADVSYKIFSFSVVTESLFGETNKQVFNICMKKDEVENYMTKIE